MVFKGLLRARNYVNNNPLSRPTKSPSFHSYRYNSKWDGGEYFVHHGGSRVGTEVGIELTLNEAC